MGSTTVRYSESMIFEILSKVQRGELSINKARRIYGIGGKMTINRWLERYCKSKTTRTESRKVMPNKNKKAVTPILNKDAALSEAQLKLEYYETIFNLAREKYGLDFKKILGSGGKKPFK